MNRDRKLNYVVAFGTRPELIKLAPVILELGVDPYLELTVVFTGQHELSVLGLESFPDVNIDVQWNVMLSGQTLSELTSRLFDNFGQYFKSNKPDLVIVHGDTHTAMVASMSAFFAGIEVAHVEAGLRTHSLKAPFPEEFNRQAIARIATYHFAPSAQACSNLAQENIPSTSIFLTGNTVVDALISVSSKLRQDQVFFDEVRGSLGELANLIDSHKTLHLVTSHRRENAGAGLQGILAGVKRFALKNPTSLVVFAMHPNPALQVIIRENLAGVSNIYLSLPFSYSQMVFLLNRSSSVVTDSGGIQEEAATLGVPVLVTRAGTERGEAARAGLLKVVGTEAEVIAEQMRQIDLYSREFSVSPMTRFIYGDGLAARRIAAILTGKEFSPWEPEIN